MSKFILYISIFYKSSSLSSLEILDPDPSLGKLYCNFYVIYSKIFTQLTRNSFNFLEKRSFLSMIILLLFYSISDLLLSRFSV